MWTGKFRCACLFVAALLGAAAAVSSVAQSRAACVRNDPSALRSLESVFDRLNGSYMQLLTHRCSGGLYVRVSEREIHVLHEGWWLQELVAVRWLDENTLRLRATFITGAGPDGTRPFGAEIQLARSVGGWRASEPVLAGAPFERPEAVRISGFEGRALLLSSRAALDNSRLDPHWFDVDFEQQRLFVIPVMLSSGSIRIEKIQVTDGSDRYYLHWDTNRPRIGTMDMNPSLVWVALPRDGKSLSVAGAPTEFAPCKACNSGARHHVGARLGIDFRNRKSETG